MKKRYACLLLCVALLCTGCGNSTLPIAPTAAPTPAPTPTASPIPTQPPSEVEKVTTMEPAQQYAGVALANNVTPEMLQPAYWLQGDADADALLMTQEEIALFNARTLEALAPLDRMFDLVATGESLEGTRVRALLAADPTVPAEDRVNGAPMPTGYLQALVKNRALESVPETVSLRYGVVVDRVNVRTQPTNDMLSAAGDAFFDDAQQAELYWNEPVLVLHESADAAWYYILTSRMDGWVPQSEIALFDTRADWLAWQQPTDFLVVTANRFRLDHNTACPALSQREIGMGTVLPLLRETSAETAGRLAIGNYIATMPLRGADGRVEYHSVPVPVSAGVSRGYLPYTRRAVLAQLFEMQGTNYGWGGTQGANDCSGIAVQVYRCFGFELARNSKSLSMLPCKTVELAGLGDAARAAALTKAPAGSVLYFPGHIMLYLGAREGRYYVMSAVGSLDLYGTGNENRILTVLINDLEVKRSDGVSWLQQLRAIKILEQ